MHFTIIALSLMLAPSVYGYARSCKRHAEPCISVRYSRSSPVRYFPHSQQYGCCNGNVFDQKNYVCASFGGSPTIVPCNPCSQFRCADGQCALRDWKCTGYKDCVDGTDEVGCSPCKKFQFRYANGRCISRRKICDKHNDCGDGTDEIYCLRKSGGGCGNKRYRCRNDHCISLTLMCNDHDDCGDGSDDENCAPYNNKKRNEISGQDTVEDDEDGKAKDADSDTFS